MASICKGKKSWPELVGVDGDTAAAVIERENCDVTAIVVLEGSSVIENFSCKRVWVWINETRIVTQTPEVG